MRESEISRCGFSSNLSFSHGHVINVSPSHDLVTQHALARVAQSRKQLAHKSVSCSRSLFRAAGSVANAGGRGQFDENSAATRS